MNALVLLSLGLGTLLVASRPGASREAVSPSLRERAIEAQRISARASLRARELTARWSAEQDARRAPRST